jgi:hypothetical protein
LAVIEEEQEQQQECQRERQEEDAVAVFVYALRATETKRQWPRRLKAFFDFFDFRGTLKEQATSFLNKARRDPRWAQGGFMRFLNFQHERVSKGEISESTVPNYYKAAKLFCDMTDVVLSWKKIGRGIVRGRQAANDRAPTLEIIPPCGAEK